MLKVAGEEFLVIDKKGEQHNIDYISDMITNIPMNNVHAKNAGINKGT